MLLPPTYPTLAAPFVVLSLFVCMSNWSHPVSGYILTCSFILKLTFSGKLMPLGSNDDYNEENVFDANSSSGFFSSSRSSPRSQSGGSGFDPTGSERFSRKVFVGGLPPDIGKKSTI